MPVPEVGCNVVIPAGSVRDQLKVEEATVLESTIRSLVPPLQNSWDALVAETTGISLTVTMASVDVTVLQLLTTTRK